LNEGHEPEGKVETGEEGVAVQVSGGERGEGREGGREGGRESVTLCSCVKRRSNVDNKLRKDGSDPAA
jgi:hypothetical protein